MKPPKLTVQFGKAVSGRLNDPSPEVREMIARYRRGKTSRALLLQLAPSDEAGSFTGRLCEFSGAELRVLTTEAGILANLITVHKKSNQQEE